MKLLDRLTWVALRVAQSEQWILALAYLKTEQNSVVVGKKCEMIDTIKDQGIKKEKKKGVSMTGWTLCIGYRSSDLFCHTCSLQAALVIIIHLLYICIIPHVIPFPSLVLSCYLGVSQWYLKRVIFIMNNGALSVSQSCLRTSHKVGWQIQPMFFP